VFCILIFYRFNIFFKIISGKLNYFYSGGCCRILSIEMAVFQLYVVDKVAVVMFQMFSAIRSLLSISVGGRVFLRFCISIHGILIVCRLYVPPPLYGSRRIFRIHLRFLSMYVFDCPIGVGNLRGYW
jgi:hypothetical protein